MGANYLSILKPCAANGNLQLELRTIDATSSVDLTVNVPLLVNDTEKVVAKKVEDTLNAYFAANTDPETEKTYVYSGQPSFSSGGYPGTFRIHRTEHILSIWSQANWVLDVVNDATTLTRAVAGPKPVLVTVAQINALAPILSLDLLQDSGVALTELQIVELLTLSSAELCERINNKIVATTYLHECSGRQAGMMRGRVRPGLNWDLPATKDSTLFGIGYDSFTDIGRGKWNFINKWSQLEYRGANSLFGNSPLAMEAEVKWTYVAGHYQIDPLIRSVLSQIAMRILEDTDFSMIQVGTWRAEREGIDKILTDMYSKLRGYWM